MSIYNLLFLIIFLIVLFLFFLNIRRIWLMINSMAGYEIDRKKYPLKRFLNLIKTVFLQKKMFDKKLIAIIHYVIFIGFIVITLSTIEIILNGIWSGFSFEVLGKTFYNFFLISQDIFNFAVFVAIIIAFVKKIIFTPKRFETLKKSSKIDAYIVLAFIGLLVLSELFLIGCKKNLYNANYSVFFSNFIVNNFIYIFDLENKIKLIYDISWYVHVSVLFSFISFLPFSKHQHIIWVWQNMFFKNLKNSGYIKNMPISDEQERFGAGLPIEFSWKQALDSFTCVECGRCDQVCPATNTGKSLKPRSIINNIKRSILSHFNSNKKDQEIIPNFIKEQQVWDCTTCGACIQACPLEIEHISPLIDMRRYMALTKGDISEEMQDLFQKLENQSNPWGLDNSKRADWADGLDINIMSKNQNVEYLFWVGCSGSFDSKYKEVTKSITRVFKKSGISFGILGQEEKCNGDIARRMGNEYLAQIQIEENIEIFKKYNIKKIITACPHCFNIFKNEYGDFGFKAQVFHYNDIIDDLISEGKIKINKKLKEKITYHDSCYLGRHNQKYDSPRKILSKLSDDFVEIVKNKDKAMCCGGGGGHMWIENQDKSSINNCRAKELADISADTIAISCPFCMTMIDDGLKSQNLKNKPKVKDIAELVDESLS